MAWVIGNAAILIASVLGICGIIGMIWNFVDYQVYRYPNSGGFFTSAVMFLISAFMFWFVLVWSGHRW